MRAHFATRRRSRHGISTVELLATCLILAFVVVGTVQLYRIGDSQQRSARFYSDAQTNTREAMRRMLRTVRHTFKVDATGIFTFFGNGRPLSNASQIVISVPQVTPGAGIDRIYLHVTGGTLYAQRTDDTTAGIVIATGVQTLTFNYFRTSLVAGGGATRAAVDATPGSANEVQITLVLKSGTVTTTEVADIALRNNRLGL